MNQKLLDNNYILIPNFISTYRAFQLGTEFRDYCEAQKLKGDEQAPNSHSKYNYLPFLELLCEKTQEISSIIEETVLPTYSYARVYLNGSILERHKDRDACEVSLTVHLDSDASWPIYIQTPSGEERSVILNPGDAMLYLGKVADHWRDQYSGKFYTQTFLHYVRSRGDCSYAYFDKTKTNENEDDINLNLDKSSITQVEEKNKSDPTPTLIVPKPRTKLEDFIHVFDDILPKSLCDDILGEYKGSLDWSPSLISNGIIHKDSRNCDQILISDPCVIEKNYQARKLLDSRIHDSIRSAVQKYHELHNSFNISIDTGYQLLRYDQGQFYTEHTDSFKEQQRSVSCSIQLNQDYDGGEFAFFGREMIIRSSAGSVVMFPSNFMYPHEIMPVTKGTRYSIITWFV